jgi:hypothetical protein
VFEKVQPGISIIITTVNIRKTSNGCGPHKEKSSATSLQILRRGHRGTVIDKKRKLVFPISDKVLSLSSSKEYYGG